MKLPSLIFAALMAAAGAAQAGTVRYTANLTGIAENPDVVTPAVGWVEVIYDDIAHTMKIHSEFSGLLGNTTNAHIHCCSADPLVNVGVATRIPTLFGFPAGVTAGIFDALYDMTLASSWNAAFITSSGGTTTLAETRFFAAMGRGETYFNIHTQLFPGGEIRGTLIPEPGALALTLAALLAAGALSRRRSAAVALTP